MAHIIEQPPSRYAGHDSDSNAHDPEVVLMRGINNSDGAYSNGFRYANGGDFPDNLPPPPLATPWWKQRWHNFSVSYSLIHTPDGKVRMRHLAMLTILALRTGMSALSILSAIIKGSVAQIFIYSLLTLLGFWFTATSLAIISNSEGEKPLWRFQIVRSP
jgi:hypothetical protein